MSMSNLAEGFIKHTEETFGAPHPTRERVIGARRIVVKVIFPFLTPKLPAILPVLLASATCNA